MAAWLKRYRRRHKRSHGISRRRNNDFLVVFLTLVVLLETVLILFLIPQVSPKKRSTIASKKSVRAEVQKIVRREPEEKITAKQPQEKTIARLDSLLQMSRRLSSEGKGKIAIVIDDWGYSANNLDLLGDIDLPLTLAILPFRSYSKKIAEFGNEHNFQIIIHMPMEPEYKNKVDLEPETLMVLMSERTIKKILNDALINVPFARGINNHMGSLATRDKEFMAIILNELKERGLFFLDSLVVYNSVCEDVAQDIGLKFAKRTIFLDNESNPEYIRGQLMELVNEADKKGKAVGIGHDKKNTLNVLKEVMPQLAKQGYRFVFLSDVAE